MSVATVRSGGVCSQFRANVFSRARCQYCFKPSEAHPSSALASSTMRRRVLASSFLYVAPPTLDFSSPTHSQKRWQRRWFTLYDDGELKYALDDSPDTVPQLRMNMQLCTRVIVADSITNHPHSLLIAFKNDDLVDTMKTATAESADQSTSKHPVICYIKADCSDEIRWWQGVLQAFANNETQLKPLRRSTDASTSHYSGLHASTSSLQCDSPHADVSRAASAEPHALNNCEQLDEPAAAFDDRSCTHCSVGDGDDEREDEDEDHEDTSPQVQTEITSPPADQLPVASTAVAPKAESSSSSGLTRTALPAIDTDNQTLRKGWLMLRSKNDSLRKWCVLSGLQLKLYSDVWVEQTSEPELCIDLSECINVYPAATRNYGIEIKCKKARYVLSAMTPGIRDSWIQAIQMNLNPSPSADGGMTTVDGTGTQGDAMSVTDSNDFLSATRRKKNYAFVAPESHHSNSLIDIYSSSTENDEDRQSVRPTFDIPDPPYYHISAPSPLSSSAVASIAAAPVEVAAVSAGTESPDSMRRGAARRQPAVVSPSMRRSPVARLKERDYQARLAAAAAAAVASASAPNTANAAAIFTTRSRFASSLSANHAERSALDAAVATGSIALNYTTSAAPIEERIGDLRTQLWHTRRRLDDSPRTSDLSSSPHDLQDINHLRQCLAVAEANVARQQNEMDVLRQSLASTATSDVQHTDSNSFSKEIGRRLIALLKIQVGALSKLLHSSKATSFLFLRKYVDSLIRTIASLDEDAPLNANVIEAAFKEVIAAYEKLSVVLESRTIKLDGVNTNNTHLVRNAELAAELREMEAEIERLQSSHGRDIDNQRVEYEQQLTELRERIVCNEEEKRQLLQYDNERERLKLEYEQKLKEEEQSTRVALSAVNRFLGEELKRAQVAAQAQAAAQECKCQQSTAASAASESRLRVENSRLQQELQQKTDSCGILQRRLDHLESCLQASTVNNNNDKTSEEDDEHASLDTTVTLAGKGQLLAPTNRFRAAGTLSRKPGVNRRTDVRYHSNPVIPVYSDPVISTRCIKEPLYFLPSNDQRRTLADRIKFFERAEYKGPY